MLDSISDILIGLSFLVLFATFIGLISPRLVLMRSRGAVIAGGILCWIVTAVTGAGLMSDFRAGHSSFDARNWENAVTRLSAVQTGDARYDSAQVLLRVARASLAEERANVARSLREERANAARLLREERVSAARDLLSRGELEEARTAIAALSDVPPDLRAGLRALEETAAWGERYQDLYYATNTLNVRRGRGSDHEVALQLAKYDAVQIGPPDSAGWAVLHRRHAYTGNGITVHAEFAEPRTIAADTLGYIKADLLSRETPAPPAKRTTRSTGRARSAPGECGRLREFGRATERAMAAAIRADNAEERRNGAVIPGQERQFTRREEDLIKHGIEMKLMYEQLKAQCGVYD